MVLKISCKIHSISASCIGSEGSTHGQTDIYYIPPPAAPVRAKSVSERRKSVTTGRTNERTDSRSPIYPYPFLAEVYKSYQKLTLEI
jgi:hypothetical protein